MVTGSAMDSSEECIDYQDSRFTWLPDLTELPRRMSLACEAQNGDTKYLSYTLKEIYTQ